MTAEATASANQFWLRIILIGSVLFCAVVVFLLVGPRPEGTRGSLDVSALPAVNAGLNAIAAVLLLVAFWFIRRRDIAKHKTAMMAAFAASAAFIVCYATYHWFKSGPQPYTGSYRGLYMVILVSHITLAAIIVPLALVTLQRGWSMQRRRHRKLAKFTLPLWLYVSLSGVTIYGMLYL